MFSFCGALERDCKQDPRCNIHAFLRVASETKRQQDDTTGAFGIGFVASYQIADHPEVMSAGLHITLRPEQMSPEDRVVVCSGCRHCEAQVGTLFRLPWAGPDSELRKRLGQEARHNPDELTEELRNCLRDSLPFLQRLKRIELARDGKDIAQFERERTNDFVRLTGPGDESLELHRFFGNFDDEAAELRTRKSAPIEDKRKSRIEVLVSNALEVGRIHAVLPTEEPFPATMLVSADFFPRSDRRSIALDEGTRADWNRAALAAAGRVIAERLEVVTEAIGPLAAWRLIGTIRRTALDARDAAFEALWPTVCEALEEAAVTPTTTGDLKIARDVLFLPSPDDDVSSDILTQLGANVLLAEVRDFIQPLPRTEFGMRELSATTLAELIEDTDLDALNEAALEDLWTLMERIVVRDRGTSRATHSEEVLRATRSAPAVDVGLVTWDEITCADQTATKLLARYVCLADAERLGGHRDLLAHLARPLRADEELIRAIAEGEPDGDELSLARWLYGRRDEWIDDDALVAAVAELPIFPKRAGGEQQFVALAELGLPTGRRGTFVDEAEIAKVLDSAAGAEVVELAKLLGISELTLESYVENQVPKALADAEAEVRKPPWIDDLLRTLAGQTEEILGSARLKAVLEDLPIVPCGDRCVPPAEAVFEHESLIVALGADWPTYDGPRVASDLLADLGVSHSPQPHHIVRRVEELTEDSPTEESVVAIRELLKLMASRYSIHGQGQKAAWREAIEDDFSALLERDWLPAEGDRSDWWSPEDLFLHNRAFLFKSQGRFLDMSVREENAIVDLLEALGLRSNPPLDMVTAHLRHCCESGEEPPRGIYDELSSRIAELTEDQRDALQEFPSLRLPDETWAPPDAVFWEEPGLGPFGKRLDASWNQWRPLLDAIGVREEPDGDDAIRVLTGIAERPEIEPPAVEAIVTRCWQILAVALDDGDIAPGEIRAQLGDVHCVSAEAELLRPPEVYVDDRPQLTQQLQSRLGGTLVTRPEATWPALEAAGVREISDLLIAQPTYASSAPHNALKRALHERRPQIARVLESALGSAHAAEALDGLEALSIVVAQELAVSWYFELDRSVRVEASDAGAVWSQQDGVLYVEPGEFGIDLAREFAFALDADPVKLALLEKVLGADDEDEADAILDRLSVPRLAHTLDIEESEAVGVGASDEDSCSDGPADEGSEPEQPVDSADDDEEERPESEDGSDEDPASTSRNGHRTVEPGGGDHGSGGGRGESAGTQFSGTHGPRTGTRTRRARTASTHESWQVHLSGRGAARDEDDPTPGTPQHDRWMAIDQAGVNAVLEFEANAGRHAETMPHDNPGYDVLSRDADGRVARYIEVKSLAGAWGEGRSFPRLTLRQFEFAQGRHLDAGNHPVDPEQVWLYVVEHAETSPRITPINDPAGRATRFVFDQGWRVLGEITLDEADIDDIAGMAQASGLPAPVRRYLPDPEDPDVVFELAWPTLKVAIVGADDGAEDIDGWRVLHLGSLRPGELLDILTTNGDGP